jgi:alkanesulfonate monooxygenase SsuD/methylene tetrahydromethanopterin reductase-like flavin-dependent oxidoreductase (luciferase family)
VKLTALDLHHPSLSVQTAVRLEAAGYHRYWASEHHTPQQSASPSLVVAAASAVTSRIRLGTAGVFLHLHPVYRVVEEMALLAVLCGAHRLDIGVTAALPASALVPMFCNPAYRPSRVAYAARVSELVRLVRDAPERLLGLPGGACAPQIWVCGQSADSARLAGRLGVNYAFHHHQFVNAGGTTEAARDIRAQFDAAGAPGAPGQFTVVCVGVCAEAADAARAAWECLVDAARRMGAPLPSPTFLGSPTQCRTQLLDVAASYRCDELVVHCLGPDFESRMRGFELVGDACGVCAVTAA